MKKMTADCTIGFLILSRKEGHQDASPAGSGTLVSINGYDGILTAAHVVDVLESHCEIGILRFPENSCSHQSFKLCMEHTDILKLGVPPYEEDSPDLAFIKLHSEDAGRFKARNTFKNLNRLKDNMLSEELSLKSGFIGISGEIAEWADEETNISDFHRVKGFGGLFGVSNVICSKECDGWDYIKCHVDFSPETELPNSYAGMSGGGLWNIVLAKQDGEINVTDCRLCGVVFRQSSVIDGGKRIVSCQGPLSVYSKLFQAVERQWPK